MPLWTGQPLAYPTVQKTGAAAMLAIAEERCATDEVIAKLTVAIVANATR